MVKKRVLTERLGITVSPELKDKLDRIRQRKMLSWSELIREVIKDYLKGGEIMKKIALILAVLMLFSSIAQAGGLMISDPLKEQPVILAQSEMTFEECKVKLEKVEKENKKITIGILFLTVTAFLLGFAQSQTN